MKIKGPNAIHYYFVAGVSRRFAILFSDPDYWKGWNFHRVQKNKCVCQKPFILGLIIDIRGPVNRRKFDSL